ncbi:hypothetical protein, partial [Sulfitobacter sp. 1A12157]|uniref:hypothetical protein n=1 Tax=Sulfitobacter sp. 1A12157 TaxID=3368594 RepID=UPI00374610EE
DIKFSNSVETKETEMRPNLSARPASITSNSYPPRDPNIRVSAAVRPVWRPAVRLSAAGEGGSKASGAKPQAEI